MSLVFFLLRFLLRFQNAVKNACVLRHYETVVAFSMTFFVNTPRKKTDIDVDIAHPPLCFFEKRKGLFCFSETHQFLFHTVHLHTITCKQQPRYSHYQKNMSAPMEQSISKPPATILKLLGPSYTARMSPKKSN